MSLPTWSKFLLLAPVVLAILAVVYVVAFPDPEPPMIERGEPPVRMDASTVASELLMTVKTGSPSEKAVLDLCNITDQAMEKELPTEALKRAFWLNVYNTFGQLLLEQRPVDLTSAAARTSHYGSKRICVAGRMLSLNDIEHGMLRGSRIWWSKGHLSKLFPNSFVRAFGVPVDPRIHFALNCGAASCPAIAFYDADKLDAQLDMAVRVFLKDQVRFDVATNSLSITPLFDWFKEDFDGEDGILRFLAHHGLIPEDIRPSIQYTDYDWTALTRNFQEASAGTD